MPLARSKDAVPIILKCETDFHCHASKEIATCSAGELTTDNGDTHDNSNALSAHIDS
ncbi:hypothetical protein KIN20_038234 [Parelaphostrongylus tenuis]|uniref:Uncharacterized protein n=1 Tax=Parelaphostrongylus tenuis TaxID=148309 RepID=A0AAD5RFB3_PARTN|nr:hypothetical protein KIN20_038234 [Parelaphostrongylus tenuis]